LTLAVITLLSYKDLPYSVSEWLGHAAGNTHPCTVKVKRAWSHTSAPSCVFMARLLPFVNYCNYRVAHEMSYH